MNYILLLAYIAVLVIGQVFFKLGLQQIGGVNFANVWKAFLSPYVILGLALYVAATGVWFVILSRMPLSVAYPLQSLAYVFGILLAWTIFHEQVGPVKWVGAIFIIVGAVLISYDK